MNVKLFQKLRCEDCGSTENLHCHTYNDRVKCESCINFQLMEASEEIFTHGNLYELEQEREA